MSRLASMLAAAALLAGLPARADVAPPPKTAPSAKPDGKQIFAARCAGCHGADGRAESAYGKQHSIPDFTSKAWSAKQSEKDQIATVTDGELEADMPAFSGQLSAAEIKAVVGYVRGLPAAKK